MRTSITGGMLFALLALSILSTLVVGQYNFDIQPNSRLLQSLGLASPDVQPISSSWNGISSSRVLADSYEPISAAYIQPPSAPSVYTSQPKELTYLTVAERPALKPRPRQRVTTATGRSQTVLTVSDAARRRNNLPPPLPATYSNEVTDDANLRPYSFQYDANDDETGLRSSRSEKSDGRTVTGSYSYYDPDGVYRVVEYVADEKGFRANIKTNEPGTAKPASVDPANTQWQIQPPPQQVVDKYLKRY